MIFSFEIAYAAKSNNASLGGRVSNIKATEIEDLESSGFTCQMAGGQSIEVKPARGVTSYYIPANVQSWTKNKIRAGQWIVGKYSNATASVTTITCVYDADEEITEEVVLHTIISYGTSR